MSKRIQADRAVGAVAGGQRTIVTHEQLLRCGLERSGIAHRRRTGRLHVIFRGVYAYGSGSLPPLAMEQAALLACGDRAFLSHATSGAMWGLLAESPLEPEVTVIDGDCSARKGIRLHRVCSVDRRELRRKDGLPLSSPARALLVLAATSERNHVERAFDEAFARRLVRTPDLEAVLSRHPGARGSARLRALLESATSEGFLRSRGERVFRGLLRKAGMSQPESNVRIGPYTVDFVWRDLRLIVEFDGWEFHRGREKFESDRARDAALKAAGWEVIRFTWRQVLEQPELVLFQLAQIMAAISPRARAA